MAEPRSDFTQETKTYMEQVAPWAQWVADHLQGRATAILGAVANEYDTRHNSDPPWYDTRNGNFQQAGDRAVEFTASVRGHDFISGNYDAVKAGAPNPGGKAINPVMIDIGPGNVRVETAIELLKSVCPRPSSSSHAAVSRLTKQWPVTWSASPTTERSASVIR